MLNLNKFRAAVNYVLYGKYRDYAILMNEPKENYMARITENADTGKFEIWNGRDLAGSYSRRRDAVRGATRRGLTVA